MKNIEEHQEELFVCYSRSGNRILFLDYDGTLAPIYPHPEQALPTSVLKQLLFKLASDKSNQIVIISGREKERLEYWLGDLPVILAAEHGGFYKEPNKQWQQPFFSKPAWKARICPSLQALVFQYEGSFLEEKYYSVAWHYRAIADQIQGPEKKQILDAIRSLQTNNDFLIYDEDCTLELRTVGIDKGKLAAHYVQSNQKYDFVLALGDGRTDEDLFKTLGKDHYTIKVGKSSSSFARFYLDSQKNVIRLLNNILQKGEEFHGTASDI